MFVIYLTFILTHVIVHRFDFISHSAALKLSELALR